MSVLLRLLAVAMLWVFATVAHAATTAEIDQARNKGLAWLFTHQNGDGSWKSSSGLQVQPTAAALEALINAGVKRGYSYAAGEAWLTNAEASSTDSLARQIIALMKTGANVTPKLDQLLGMKNMPDRATWGAYSTFDTSFPDTPLALRAIRTGQYSYANQLNELYAALYCEVLPAQRTDGGWSYIKPPGSAPANQSSSVFLPTAFNILELKAIKDTYWWWSSDTCGGVTTDLQASITNGIAWLLTRKNADGGFGDNGLSSIQETVLAYMVLNAVNSSDPAKGAALDYLIARQQADGSWGSDPFTAALALQALPAVNLADADKDGIPDAVEALLGTNPLAADGRGLIGSNGASGMIQRYAITVTSGEHGYVMPFTSVSVAQGDSLEFAVAADGLYHISALLIDGNPVAAAANKTTYTYTFSNVAAHHTISASFAPDQPDIAASPASLSFTTLVCDNTSSGQTITVSNAATATAPLSISNVTLKGAANDYLIQSNNCTGAVLAAGGSCAINIAFKPRYKWQRRANVAIASNDPDTPTLYVPLIGTGADTCPVDPAVLMPILDLLFE